MHIRRLWMTLSILNKRGKLGAFFSLNHSVEISCFSSIIYKLSLTITKLDFFFVFETRSFFQFYCLAHQRSQFKRGSFRNAAVGENTFHKNIYQKLLVNKMKKVKKIVKELQDLQNFLINFLERSLAEIYTRTD